MLEWPKLTRIWDFGSQAFPTWIIVLYLSNPSCNSYSNEVTWYDQFYLHVSKNLLNKYWKFNESLFNLFIKCHYLLIIAHVTVRVCTSAFVTLFRNIPNLEIGTMGI